MVRLRSHNLVRVTKLSFRWSGRFVFALFGSTQLRMRNPQMLLFALSHMQFLLDLPPSNLTFQASIRAQCCTMGEASSS